MDDISLRDWFAGLFMLGYTINPPTTVNDGNLSPEEVVRESWWWADKMIAQRENQKD